MPKKKFIDEPGYKTCTKCEITYKCSIEHFHRNERCFDRLQAWCRDCCNKSRRERWHTKKSHKIPKNCRGCGNFFYACRAEINRRKRRFKNTDIYCSHECLVKNADYSLHMGMKGKSWNGKRQGENNPNSLLNNSQVIEIKNKIKEGWRIIDICKMFEVKHNTIHSIKSGKTWSHISI